MNSSPKKDSAALISIATVSFLVIFFLVWWIYFKSAATSNHGFVALLPAINACLNGLTAILLLIGLRFIRMGNKAAHIKTMLLATATSALFLISYLLYHHYAGDTKFLATGMVRPIYFFILISHIVLSIPQVFLIFTTLYFAFSGNFEKHRKFARFTFPIWLYVSVTGVLIFFFLKIFNT
ncbi:MAG: DUF420 domain-containing protein [Halobacteriovoraceae bacterium]|jgi:putative membrane protein|nr:DUF420 domain-containing protein [Halobacteriovoraceae bacterium]MBT5093779.1 DUF420 domain-containing protein [Halobacteriovoraceae bacterium]